MNTLHYGCDYNPEQWDAATIDADFALMADAGVTWLTVGVFAWASLEPAPGDFEPALLDAVLDRAQAQGVAVCLATPTAAPPPWFAHLYPDQLVVTDDGRRMSGASRSFVCPSSPPFRRHADQISSRVAQRYGAHPALALWHIDNEYSGAGCYCDRCAQRFRGWLADRYGTVDALVDAWGGHVWSQVYGSFDEVAPPRATTDLLNPSALLDWRRFVDGLQRSNYLAERAVVRQHSPAVPVTTNFMGAYPLLDYWAWAEQCDVIAGDAYPDPAEQTAARDLAFDADLMRSLGGGRPFVRMEQTTGAVQWRAVNTPKAPGQYRLWSLQSVARGADAICQFQWRASHAGAETFHAAMVPHAGTDTRIWSEVRQLGADLRRLTALAGTRVPANVAIVLDWPSRWARGAAHGPDDRPALDQVRAWYDALWEMNVPVDLVPAEADLDRYRLVVTAGQFLVGASQGDRYERFVESGGTLVAEALTGVVDERLHAHLGGYVATSVPVLGVQVLEHWPLQTTTRTAGATGPISAAAATPPTSLVTHTPDVGELTLRLLVEDVRSLGAEVVSAFGPGPLHGRPAVLRARAGLGTAWYVAGRLTPVSLAAFAAHVLDLAGVEPTVAEAPAGVEAVRRGDVLVLLNHGPAAATVAGVEGIDLLSGRRWAGEVVVEGLGVVAVASLGTSPVETST